MLVAGIIIGLLGKVRRSGRPGQHSALAHRDLRHRRMLIGYYLAAALGVEETRGVA